MVGIDISNAELNVMINKFLKTTEGRRVAKEQGASVGYTDSELVRLAEELKSMITRAFISIQHQRNKHFDDSAVKIQAIRENRSNTEGDKYIRISYPSKTLHRYSLVALDQSNRSGKLYEGSELYHTGKGVDDIFALITQGYNARSRVYGYWADTEGWERDDYHGLTASLRSREPNAFLSETIERFKSRHPDVEVSYPDEWKVGGSI